METQDRELILKFMDKDLRLRHLYSKHRELDQRLIKLSNRLYLSNDDQMLQQKLKKEKLRGVEEMLSIVRDQQHRAA